MTTADGDDLAGSIPERVDSGFDYTDL